MTSSRRHHAVQAPKESSTQEIQFLPCVLGKGAFAQVRLGCITRTTTSPRKAPKKEDEQEVEDEVQEQVAIKTIRCSRSLNSPNLRSCSTRRGPRGAGLDSPESDVDCESPSAARHDREGSYRGAVRERGILSAISADGGHPFISRLVATWEEGESPASSTGASRHGSNGRGTGGVGAGGTGVLVHLAFALHLLHQMNQTGGVGRTGPGVTPTPTPSSTSIVDLGTVLAERGRISDVFQVRWLGLQIAEGVRFLAEERGIIHRDLKPENVVLKNGAYVEIVDFGCARELGIGDASYSNEGIESKGRNSPKTYTICGTPAYLAPEMLLEKGHSFPVDVYQMGVLLYELYVGVPPYYQSANEADYPQELYRSILDGAVRFSDDLFGHKAVMAYEEQYQEERLSESAKRTAYHTSVGVGAEQGDGSGDTSSHQEPVGDESQLVLQAKREAVGKPRNAFCGCCGRSKSSPSQGQGARHDELEEEKGARRNPSKNSAQNINNMSDHFGTTLQSFRQLLQSLLKRDPSRRPDAREVIDDYPFFRGSGLDLEQMKRLSMDYALGQRSGVMEYMSRASATTRTKDGRAAQLVGGKSSRGSKPARSGKKTNEKLERDEDYFLS